MARPCDRSRHLLAPRSQIGFRQCELGECAHAVLHRGFEQADGKIVPIEIERTEQSLGDVGRLGIASLVPVV